MNFAALPRRATYLAAVMAGLCGIPAVAHAIPSSIGFSVKPGGQVSPPGADFNNANEAIIPNATGDIVTESNGTGVFSPLAADVNIAATNTMFDVSYPASTSDHSLSNAFTASLKGDTFTFTSYQITSKVDNGTSSGTLTLAFTGTVSGTDVSGLALGYGTVNFNRTGPAGAAIATSGTLYFDSSSIVGQVPEPASIAVLGAAVIGLGAVRFRVKS